MTESAMLSAPQSANPLGAYSPVHIVPIGTIKLVRVESSI